MAAGEGRGGGATQVPPRSGGWTDSWPVPQALGELSEAWMERLRRAGLLSPLLPGPGSGGGEGGD